MLHMRHGPGEFYALHPHVQSMWLGHAYNKICGAYNRPLKVAAEATTVGDITITADAQALLEAM